MKYIFYVITIFILCYLVHEGGHILGIILGGGRIRAVFLPLIIIYYDSKWKFKLNSNLSKANVLIDIETIDQDNYIKYRKLLRSELLLGIVFTVLFEILQIVFILIVIYHKNQMGLDQRLLYIVLIAITNLTFIFNCFKNNGNMICDYYAYKCLKQNEVFYQVYLLEYLMVSSNYTVKLKASSFLLKKIEDTLTVKIEDIYSEDMLYILYNYITLYVAGYVGNNKTLKQTINKLIEDNVIFYEEESIIENILVMRIIQYLYISEQNKKALELYTMFCNKDFESHSEILGYYVRQTKYILQIDNEKSYLLDEKNINSSLVNKEYSIFANTTQLCRDIILQ